MTQGNRNVLLFPEAGGSELDVVTETLGKRSYGLTAPVGIDAGEGGVKVSGNETAVPQCSHDADEQMPAATSSLRCGPTERPA